MNEHEEITELFDKYLLVRLKDKKNPPSAGELQVILRRIKDLDMDTLPGDNTAGELLLKLHGSTLPPLDIETPDKATR